MTRKWLRKKKTKISRQLTWGVSQSAPPLQFLCGLDLSLLTVSFQKCTPACPQVSSGRILQQPHTLFNVQQLPRPHRSGFMSTDRSSVKLNIWKWNENVFTLKSLRPKNECMDACWTTCRWKLIWVTAAKSFNLCSRSARVFGSLIEMTDSEISEMAVVEGKVGRRNDTWSCWLFAYMYVHTYTHIQHMCV